MSERDTRDEDAEPLSGTWVQVDYRVVAADDGLAALLGARTPGDLIGREVDDFVASSSKPALLAGRELRAAGYIPGPQLITLRALDGTERRCLVSSDITEFDGVLAVLGTARQIIEAPRLMRQMISDVISDVVSDVSDAVIATDPDLRVLSWNSAAARLYGWSEQEVLGHTLHAVIGGDTEHHGSTAWDELQLNDRWMGVVSRRTRDGTVITVGSSISLLRDQGVTIGIVTVHRLNPPTRLTGDAPTELAASLISIDPTRPAEQKMAEKLAGELEGQTRAAIAVEPIASGTHVNGSVDQIQREAIALAALDRSHDLIAVLDVHGVIVLANAAWRAAADRVHPSSGPVDCGVDYLAVCDRVHEPVVAQGIRSVVLGDRQRFEADCRRGSALEEAWFALDVSALEDPVGGVIVNYSDITARVAASDAHRTRAVDPVTLLPTSTAGVAGLAQKLALAQSRGTSLAVVTIMLADLAALESRLGRRGGDELVKQVIARVLHLTRADDAMVRTSTTELTLFASVANVPAAELLRERLDQVLNFSYVVGGSATSCRCDVSVVPSDRFSTVDSLLRTAGTSATFQGPTAFETDPATDLGKDGKSGGSRNDGADVAMVVYTLPDGLIQTANTAARSLFGLKGHTPGQLDLRDIADPTEVPHPTAALDVLNSGAAYAYRAQRVVVTAENTVNVVTSVRRLLISAGPIAVMLSVPTDAGGTIGAFGDDPFEIALVAGTLDAQGVVSSVSVPNSPMEADLIAALNGTLQLAAHPDDAGPVDAMLATMRARGHASGTFRVLRARQGWVLCRCQLFVIERHHAGDSGIETTAASTRAFAFVLSVDVSTHLMIEKIERLERHIRRIGSEVHTADLELIGQPSLARTVSTMLDSLALTARQHNIVERLLNGQRVPSIAAELQVSTSTVRNHLSHVYQLAGVHSQQELMDYLRAT